MQKPKSKNINNTADHKSANTNCCHLHCTYFRTHLWTVGRLQTICLNGSCFEPYGYFSVTRRSTQLAVYHHLSTIYHYHNHVFAIWSDCSCDGSDCTHSHWLFLQWPNVCLLPSASQFTIITVVRCVFCFYFFLLLPLAVAVVFQSIFLCIFEPFCM